MRTSIYAARLSCFKSKCFTHKQLTMEQVRNQILWRPRHFRVAHKDFKDRHRPCWCNYMYVMVGGSIHATRSSIELWARGNWTNVSLGCSLFLFHSLSLYLSVSCIFISKTKYSAKVLNHPSIALHQPPISVQNSCHSLHSQRRRLSNKLISNIHNIPKAIQQSIA